MNKQMRFQFQGTTYDVQVERRGSSLIFTRDGKSYKVDLIDETQTISNQYVSAVPRSTDPPAASRPPAPAASVAPVVSPGPVAPPTPAGEGAEVAPLTGTIKEIKVAPGDPVKAGQLMIMMEAMKMDIEVSANNSGTVKAILVNLGESVKEKQPLITLNGSNE